MGVYLGEHMMNVAYLQRRSSEIPLEVELSEAAGVKMWSDGCYVIGRVGDKTLRAVVQAKAEAGVR